MSTRRARCAVAALAAAARLAGAQPAGGPDSLAPRPGIARIDAVVQQRLQLTDDQAARLRETAGRYAQQRRALVQDERAARQQVRQQVARGPAADQARVQAGLDRIYQIQQRRTELAAGEQRDLAQFLSPTQRAQFAGMQERAFRAAQEARVRREAGLPPAAPIPPGAAAAQPPRAEQPAEREAERQAQRQTARAAHQAAHQAARAGQGTAPQQPR